MLLYCLMLYRILYNSRIVVMGMCWLSIAVEWLVWYSRKYGIVGSYGIVVRMVQSINVKGVAHLSIVIVV
jgi:hypothetical protein